MDRNADNSPTDVLVSTLLEIASALRFECRVDPQELSQPVSRSSEAASDMGLASRLDPPRSTLAGGKGLIVDCYAILISKLPAAESDTSRGNPDLHLEVARQQRRAAVALTWLPSVMRTDLNLFMVAPPGAAESPEWVDFAALAERNEQVCRKLVWLPPADASAWKSSAKSFCNRTFLARPWAAQNQPSGFPQLDPLAGLRQADDRTARWLALIEQGVEEDSDLADALLGETGTESPNVP